MTAPVKTIETYSASNREPPKTHSKEYIGGHMGIGM